MMQRIHQKLVNEIKSFKTFLSTRWLRQKTIPPCLLCNSFEVFIYKSVKHIHTAGSETPNKYCRYNYSVGEDSIGQKMEGSFLLPPASVRGMTILDREAFVKKITVPLVKVRNENIHFALKYLKKFILKMCKIEPVQTDLDNQDKKVVLLNPLLVKNVVDIKEELDKISLQGDTDFQSKEIILCYDNWKAEDIIKSVLPENQEGAQGYSIIGHIIHLNLRDHVLPYKSLIGEVLLEKNSNISLVVNKTNIIDSTYRNFVMEVLAGTGTTEVTVKENGCYFSFDFSKVYWNPRLNTEHERIVKRIKQGDILYDIMAGVGPFAIPAGKKKCNVLANDLNPNSYEALVCNVTKNKVKERVKCYNLDGHEFIKSVMKESLLETWNNPYFCGNIHVTMNLPATAITFLPTFIGLFSEDDNIPENAPLPLIHVYMFTQDRKEDTAIRMVAEQLRYTNRNSLNRLNDVIVNSENGGYDSDCLEEFKKFVDSVDFVRQVAPNKCMMHVGFTLQLDVLIKNDQLSCIRPVKKLKTL